MSTIRMNFPAMRRAVMFAPHTEFMLERANRLIRRRCCTGCYIQIKDAAEQPGPVPIRGSHLHFVAVYTLLAPVYGWFTEGFDTANLQEAKALLNELVE